MSREDQISANICTLHQTHISISSHVFNFPAIWLVCISVMGYDRGDACPDILIIRHREYRYSYRAAYDGLARASIGTECKANSRDNRKDFPPGQL